MLNDMSPFGIDRDKGNPAKKFVFFAKISAMSALSLAAISVWANSSLMNCIKDREQYYKSGVYRMVPERAMAAAYYHCRKKA